MSRAVTAVFGAAGAAAFCAPVTRLAAKVAPRASAPASKNCRRRMGFMGESAISKLNINYRDHASGPALGALTSRGERDDRNDCRYAVAPQRARYVISNPFQCAHQRR